MKRTVEPALRIQFLGRRQRVRQFLAWCVHLYTGLGLVAAAGMAVLIVQGDAGSIRWAFVLMLVATLIDATDGTLARAIHIKEVLPGFDGRRLDDIVDFLTYTVLPLFLIWRTQILPAGSEGWLLAPLLASAYGFCQVSAKTDDGYFLGFPSYWNLIAFYLYATHTYVLPLPGWLALGLLLGFAFLTFVPTRYLYPSQRGRLNKLTNVLAGVWVMVLLAILYWMPVSADPDVGHSTTATLLPFDLVGVAAVPWLILLSLFFPIYYLGVSWAISWKIWRSHTRLRLGKESPV